MNQVYQFNCTTSLLYSELIADISASVCSLLNNGEIKNYDQTSNATSNEFNYFLFYVSFLVINGVVIFTFSFYDVLLSLY